MERENRQVVLQLPSRKKLGCNSAMAKHGETAASDRVKQLPRASDCARQRPTGRVGMGSHCEGDDDGVRGEYGTVPGMYSARKVRCPEGTVPRRYGAQEVRMAPACTSASARSSSFSLAPSAYGGSSM